jgi:phage shock protein E
MKVSFTSYVVALSMLSSLLPSLKMASSSSKRSAMFVSAFISRYQAVKTCYRVQNQAFALNTKVATFVTRTTPLQMAAPGVVCASQESIRAALDNPKTTILDVRGVDEIIADGYLKINGLQYIHAQCTPTDAPLLSVAAEDLIRDKTAPVLVYCAKGFRATKAKEVLESKGYTNVLNAGGFSDLDFLK